MKMLSCFFPTTVVFIDDCMAFTENVQSIVKHMNITCKVFTNPIKALEYINDVTNTNKLDYFNLIREGEEGTSDWKSMLLNIGALHKEIYSFDRFARISAVVADQYMPGMTGIELCSRIVDPTVQRVLLTGLADNKEGIDAFNEGYINRFLKKETEDFEKVLINTIEKSIDQYFHAHTNHILRYAAMLETSHLKDPVFADFFSKVYSRGNYVESYMLDTFGSYLLLDADGNAHMFSVLTEAELSRLIDIGIASEEITKDVLEKLMSRKFIIVFHSRNGTLPPIAEWESYLRPAERIDGYQTYYFSMLDSDRPDLDYNYIISFNMFKKSYLQAKN